MIKTLKTRQGYIKAFCDYRKVDINGKNSKQGEYLYIKEMWVHPKDRKKKLINKILGKLLASMSDIRNVYWLRDKGSCKMKIYNRDQILRRIGRVMK